MAYKQQKFIPHNSGDLELEIGVPAWSGEELLPGRRLLISVSSHNGKQRAATSLLTVMGTEPIREGSTFMTSSNPHHLAPSQEGKGRGWRNRTGFHHVSIQSVTPLKTFFLKGPPIPETKWRCQNPKNNYPFPQCLACKYQ